MRGAPSFAAPTSSAWRVSPRMQASAELTDILDRHAERHGSAKTVPDATRVDENDPQHAERSLTGFGSMGRRATAP